MCEYRGSGSGFPVPPQGFFFFCLTKAEHLREALLVRSFSRGLPEVQFWLALTQELGGYRFFVPEKVLFIYKTGEHGTKCDEAISRCREITSRQMSVRDVDLLLMETARTLYLEGRGNDEGLDPYLFWDWVQSKRQIVDDRR